MANPLRVPHGLYYITRNGRGPYDLSEDVKSALDPVELAILRKLIETAATRIKNDPDISGGPLDDHLSPGFGLYYVTTSGDDVYSLSGPDAPALRHPELAVASVLITRAQSAAKPYKAPTPPSPIPYRRRDDPSRSKGG